MSHVGPRDMIAKEWRLQLVGGLRTLLVFHVDHGHLKGVNILELISHWH